MAQITQITLKVESHNLSPVPLRRFCKVAEGSVGFSRGFRTCAEGVSSLTFALPHECGR
ncbi:MAG: hypothetical protein LBQ73_10855 [Tannerellaceae bacterium]|nr:hypothetical protein [Tannerellaceae bacterium]